MLEALIETPNPSDFVKLATEAARSNVGNVLRLQRVLEQQKTSNKSHRNLSQYTGRYKHPTWDWFIDVRQKQNGELQVAFKGLDSQAWDLNHYESDTFLWLASREEQAKRGRMTTYPLVANHFKLIFQENDQGQIDRLLWPHEAGLSQYEQYFVKSS